MLKSYGWGGGGGVVVAHVILVSAQGPNPSFFFFWGTFIRLGGLLGQGLGLGLGPGLDNNATFLGHKRHFELSLCRSIYSGGCEYNNKMSLSATTRTTQRNKIDGCYIRIFTF